MSGPTFRQWFRPIIPCTLLGAFWDWMPARYSDTADYYIEAIIGAITGFVVGFLIDLAVHRGHKPPA